MDETRRLAKAKMSEKQWTQLVARHPEYEEVQELQEQLAARSADGSPPDPEILGDIQFHFAMAKDGGLQLPRWIKASGLSPIEWGKIYRNVAAQASQHFGRSVTTRQVKRCIAEWLKFERSIKLELGNLKNGMGRESP